ncbi:unnamed protein product [Meganyctiphanes norvegica]|uniref:Uncharacterized protein n=1 Tax=Meganyctiphanes norvegica TaxID=48144 RepID=A0AAV2RHL8_MEGNR
MEVKTIVTTLGVIIGVAFNIYTFYMKREANKRKEEKHKHSMEKKNDKDSEFVQAATDGDIMTLTYLSKIPDQLSLEYVQMAHNIAEMKNNHAAIMVTQLTLDKKKKDV